MTRRDARIMDSETQRIDMTMSGRTPVRRRARRGRRTGRRRIWLIGVVLVLLGIAAGGAYLLVQDVVGAPDYPGEGTGDVVVRVQDGDSTREIGNMLLRRGVVASTRAFTRAGAGDDRLLAVQPGYYQMRLGMSGNAAVTRLLDPGSRVGQVEVRGGTQLDDTRGPDGSVTPGVVSLIAKATCAQLDGRNTCIKPEEVRATMASVDPAQLGVPDWAMAGVRRADPNRRLEGLIAPGRYDVEPGRPAADVLRGILGTSIARIEATGLVTQASGTQYSTYQLLVMSSLVEKEGIVGDFGKVAQVIHNRLAKPQRLELDSTVNYPLDLQAVRTSAADRARQGPYNTYANDGLPPTPIAAASPEAVSAALRPEAGSWLYFVRCRVDGTSCFANTLEEHKVNVSAAVAAGAF